MGTTPYEEIARAVHRALRKGLAPTNPQGCSDQESSVPLFSMTTQQQKRLEQRIRRHKNFCKQFHSNSTKNGPQSVTIARSVEFLGALNARVTAVIRALAKLRIPATYDEIISRAKKLNLFEASDEPVHVHVVPKPGGGYRLFTMDGVIRMAHRLVVRDLLSVLNLDSPFDFTAPGLGGEGAMIRFVRQQIAEGVAYWESADIINFYSSCRPEHFDWLPLPDSIIRDVLFLPKCAKIHVVGLEGLKGPSGHMKHVVGHKPYVNISPKQAIIKEVRQGLPTGSVLSPLVARALVGRILRLAHGGQNVVAVSYVDNLNWGARKASVAKSAREAFEALLNKHPAGALFLHDHRTDNAKAGPVHVLGYKLTTGNGHNGNPVHSCPGKKRFQRFHKKCLGKWQAAGCPDMEEFSLARIKEWMPSQVGWTTVPVYSENLAWTTTVLFLGDPSNNQSAG